MANIHSILPLIDNSAWRWDKNTITRRTLPPATSDALISSPNYPGYIYFGAITVTGKNGPQAKIEVEFDNANTKRSYDRLFKSGLTGSQGISPGIARFDTENDIYVAQLSPNNPIAYLDNAKISVHAPQTGEINLDAFGIKLDILDTELFAQSYREVVNDDSGGSPIDLSNKISRLNANIQTLGELLDPNMGDTVGAPRFPQNQGRQSSANEQARQSQPSESFSERSDSIQEQRRESDDPTTFKERLNQVAEDIDELDEGWI
jgi:hypothetical protein